MLPSLVVADLDGTLLHGAPTFEERDLTERTVRAVERLHDAGTRFAIATARPVSTGYRFAERLPVDACVYLNGALVDLDPAASDYDMLAGGAMPEDGHLLRFGFPSSRACEVCRRLLEEMPGLRVGIVMDDVRYTNFDVTRYWRTQTWRYTDFDDVPEGSVDKIIAFPDPDRFDRFASLVPDDLAASVSEGTMWMLMDPRADKRHALGELCEGMGVDADDVVSFGDDLIDIPMLEASGRGVAVANAVPRVLAVADEVCPSNDEDGVAQWIEGLLDGRFSPSPRGRAN